MTAITQTTWNFTCKLCTIIRNALFAFWVGTIAFGETAGRARAANELARMGYLTEAKKLMTERDNAFDNKTV
jgi:hypothetical protein